MKKFVAKLIAAVIVGVILVLVAWICRIFYWESKVRDVYTIDPSTKVIFIGNSHTGKSWKELKDFNNKVLWRSSECFLFSEMRLSELERRHQLDNVEVCVMNFDGPSMTFFNDDQIKSDILAEAPVSIKHLGIFPISKTSLLIEALEYANKQICVQERNPELTKSWISRTGEEKAAHLKRIYDVFPVDWQDPYYTREWETILMCSVERVRMICERNNIRLIFFAAPLVAENPELVDDYRFDKINSVIQKVKDMGIEFYDFRRSCPDSRFMDSHHLHDDGAEAFTREFFSTVLGA